MQELISKETETELKLFGTVFSVSFVIFMVISYFSYQKSIGNHGFLEILAPFFRSFYYNWPEWMNTPVLKLVLYSSFFVSIFIVSILFVSKLIIYMLDNYY